MQLLNPLSLNRPERLNALSTPIMECLLHGLARLANGPAVGPRGRPMRMRTGKRRSALMIISRGWPGMSPWRHGRSVHPHRWGRLAQPVLVSDWRQSRRNYRHRTSRAGQSSFAMEKSRCQTNGGTGEGCGWQETGRWIFYGLL